MEVEISGNNHRCKGVSFLTKNDLYLLIENYFIIWLYAKQKIRVMNFMHGAALERKADILRAVWLCSPMQHGCLSYFTLCWYCK